MTKFKFENLKDWQKALDLTAEVNVLKQKFPKTELYVWSSKMKRATDSIDLNIAQGSTAQTNPEFKRLLSFSNRSEAEVAGCFHIAKRRT